MCQLCLDAFNEVFPDKDDDFREFVLWEKTPFPMGSPEQIKEALVKYKSELAARGKEVG